MGITNPTIVTKYYALTKGLKGLADAGALHRLRGTGQDLLNMYRKHETTFDEVTGLALKYTKGLLHASMIGGRNRLLSVRGQDKQKVVTDLWNKYISSKENIRVNITSAIIFK